MRCAKRRMDGGVKRDGDVRKESEREAVRKEGSVCERKRNRETECEQQAARKREREREKETGREREERGERERRGCSTHR